ncbi:hypothetical protein P6709_05440 [Jeotgalibacillus sp. ET6]|uniref:hypothetical protein n=1 Tax=Jeotgalibacillus sp. ET6 TaxID=3037260 RepID=UPI002418175C|nr:hypothetical protein [Jeotgalibacillus sp. ET6]MDG5471183.1 hypothetical protein [Jeotgalibacillus sp. ET6]
MKKSIALSVITAAVVGLLIWAASTLVPFSYGEWSFFIGLGLTVLFFFFSGSGGFLSKMATFQASATVGKVQEDNEHNAYLGGIFYGLVLYTFVSLIVMLIIYF